MFNDIPIKFQSFVFTNSKGLNVFLPSSKISENPRISKNSEGHSPLFPGTTTALAILNALCTLKTAFVDFRKIVVQITAGKVAKKKIDYKESTCPASLKKAANLSVFLCEAAAC